MSCFEVNTLLTENILSSHWQVWVTFWNIDFQANFSEWWMPLPQQLFHVQLIGIWLGAKGKNVFNKFKFWLKKGVGKGVLSLNIFFTISCSFLFNFYSSVEKKCAQKGLTWLLCVLYHINQMHVTFQELIWAVYLIAIFIQNLFLYILNQF